jgi:hypothetical protein
MEDFLTGLDELIDNAEGISAIEVMGALQLAQQRLAFDLLTDDSEDEEGDEGDEGGAE